MGDYDDSRGSVTWSYILRAFVGLFAGVVVGALLGALALILLVGPGDYVHNLNDPRDRFGISGSPSDGSFTGALTFVFAFWGAVVGGPLGFIAGLFTALGKSLARARSPR
ncbi:MAG TPA: hypothetical protein VM936_06055 [Pyrinomonadaceae bacterium]|nr:hypothetical protein [Pyrinomonadaceae bacterium]